MTSPQVTLRKGIAMLLTPNVDVFVPGVAGSASFDQLRRAIAGVTHVVIGAHPDDVEVGAGPAIGHCFEQDQSGLLAVVLTDGRNPPKSGPYRDLGPAEMGQLRTREQRDAAQIGKYRAAVQLCYSSEQLRTERDLIAADLAALISATRCTDLWSHHFLDRHPTHVASAARTLDAVRLLDDDRRPDRWLGMEVWGSIDALPCSVLEEFDVSEHEALLDAVLGVFESQNRSKNYPRGVRGRYMAHATFRKSHEENSGSLLCLAVKLHRLLTEHGLTPETWTREVLRLAQEDTLQRLLAA